MLGFSKFSLRFRKMLRFHKFSLRFRKMSAFNKFLLRLGKIIRFFNFSQVSDSVTQQNVSIWENVENVFKIQQHCSLLICIHFVNSKESEALINRVKVQKKEIKTLKKERKELIKEHRLRDVNMQSKLDTLNQKLKSYEKARQSMVTKNQHIVAEMRKLQKGPKKSMFIVMTGYKLENAENVWRFSKFLTLSTK